MFYFNGSTYFTIKEVAQIWCQSPKQVRLLIDGEPGVYLVEIRDDPDAPDPLFRTTVVVASDVVRLFDAKVRSNSTAPEMNLTADDYELLFQALGITECLDYLPEGARSAAYWARALKVFHPTADVARIDAALRRMQFRAERLQARVWLTLSTRPPGDDERTRAPASRSKSNRSPESPDTSNNGLTDDANKKGAVGA